jgi:regulator of replication initiation timing
MKDKLEAILKQANISEATAQQISGGITEAFDSYVKKQDEIRKLEDKETFALVKENLEKVKLAHQTEMKTADKRLWEAKEDFQKRLNAARTGVKKLIDEDYAIHKKELAQKVKLFVESKWQATEQLIREQVAREIHEEVVTGKVNRISEAVTKFIATDTKPIIKEDKTAKEAVTKLTKEIDALKAEKTSLLKENSGLKAECKQLHEKVTKVVKPLVQKVNESKISKAIEKKQIQEQTVKDENSFISEIVHLATYNRKS